MQSFKTDIICLQYKIGGLLLAKNMEFLGM